MRAPITDKDAFVVELLARLRSRMENSGESEKSFAERVGSSEALFKNLAKGSLPSADRLTVLLAEIGDGLYLGVPPSEPPAFYVTIDGFDFASIPLHDAKPSAGPGALNDDVAIIDHLAFRLEWLRKIGVKPENAAMARVAGDSMAPAIQSGDLVLIDKSQREVPLRRRTKTSSLPPIFAFMQDGEARVKRVERPDPAMLVLLSDNPAFPPELVISPLADTLDILGQVVWSGHVWR